VQANAVKSSERNHAASGSTAVVADAGLISAANQRAIEAAILAFVLGALG
jgi:hypothetical protein